MPKKTVQNTSKTTKEGDHTSKIFVDLSEPPSPVPVKLKIPSSGLEKPKYEECIISRSSTSLSELSTLVSDELAITKGHPKKHYPPLKRETTKNITLNKESSQEVKKDKYSGSRSNSSSGEATQDETDTSSSKNSRFEIADHPRILHYYEDDHMYPFLSFEKAKQRYTYDLGPPFSDTKQYYKLSNMDQTKNYSVDLESKMEGTFINIDGKWTCFRRNYFKVNTFLQLKTKAQQQKKVDEPCWLVKDGETEYVDFFSVNLTCKVTNSDEIVTLTQLSSSRKKTRNDVSKPVPIKPSCVNVLTKKDKEKQVCHARMNFDKSTRLPCKRRNGPEAFELIVNLYANSNHKSTLIASTVSVPLKVRCSGSAKFEDKILHKKFTRSVPLVSATSFCVVPLNQPLTSTEQLRELNGKAYQNHKSYAHSDIKKCLDNTQQNIWLAKLNHKIKTGLHLPPSICQF